MSVSARPPARRLALVLTCAISTAFVARWPASEPARQPPRRPSLLVLLVVDQFRADYVDMYGSAWTRGLREVLSKGAVFTQAVVPYGVTKTCTGHASIGTGTYPSTHGMIDNDWYDRTRRQFVSCTADPAVGPVAIGSGIGVEHHSATWLRAPSLAEQLRRQSPASPRVVAIALKARSAIGLAGRGGADDAIVWEEDSGVWSTSSAFTSTPPRDVAAYVTAHPALAARGQVWNRMRLPASYQFTDRAAGEPAAGFPHVIDAPAASAFPAVWDSSPWSDAYLGDLASALVEERQLGRGSRTDLLAISFGALDYVGHTFGPRSHEVQDVLARLDVTLGLLIDRLDRAVGRDRYVLALSSDHGVAPLPEQSTGETDVRGRLSMSSVAADVDRALTVALGTRGSIEAVSTNAIYFRTGVVPRLRANAAATKTVEDALRRVPGVAGFYWSETLADHSPTEDAMLIAMRRSYFPGRSGDLTIVPAPRWVFAGAGTNHGSPYEYDTRVPLAFLGGGIRPGVYSGPATIIDIAPTLAALAGVSMPNADGHPLKEIALP